MYRNDINESLKIANKEISTLKDKIRRRNMQIKDRDTKIAELEKPKHNGVVGSTYHPSLSQHTYTQQDVRTRIVVASTTFPQEREGIDGMSHHGIRQATHKGWKFYMQLYATLTRDDTAQQFITPLVEVEITKHIKEKYNR